MAAFCVSELNIIYSDGCCRENELYLEQRIFLVVQQRVYRMTAPSSLSSSVFEQWSVLFGGILKKYFAIIF